jgi:ribosomal protein S6
MAKVERKALAKRIVSFYANKAGLSEILTYLNFNEDLLRTTMLNIIIIIIC